MFKVHRYFTRALKKYNHNKEILIERINPLREKNLQGIKLAGEGEYQMLEELYEELKEEYINLLHDTVRNEEYISSVYDKVLNHNRAWEVGLLPSTREILRQHGKDHLRAANIFAREMTRIENIDAKFGNTIRSFTELNLHIYKRAELISRFNIEGS